MNAARERLGGAAANAPARGWRCDCIGYPLSGQVVRKGDKRIAPNREPVWNAEFDSLRFRNYPRKLPAENAKNRFLAPFLFER
jgi:hypothetical protein